MNMLALLKKVPCPKCKNFTLKWSKVVRFALPPLKAIRCTACSFIEYKEDE